MKTTQAWGWLTAGVLALGLNGFYQDGGVQWAHQMVDRVAYRSEAVLALASGRADQFLSEARLVAGQNETRSCQLGTAMARLQTRMARGQAGFARVEAMTAREEAAMARLEASRARMEAQVERIRFMPAVVSSPSVRVVCPRVRVNIPRIQIPQVDIPQVKVISPVVNVGVGSGPV